LKYSEVGGIVVWKVMNISWKVGDLGKYKLKNVITYIENWKKCRCDVWDISGGQLTVMKSQSSLMLRNETKNTPVHFVNDWT
jgi:hypothetical protein